MNKLKSDIYPFNGIFRTIKAEVCDWIRNHLKTYQGANCEDRKLVVYRIYKTSKSLDKVIHVTCLLIVYCYGDWGERQIPITVRLRFNPLQTYYMTNA